MYKRVLIKLSGEALKGKQEFGLDKGMVNQVCQDIAAVHNAGYKVAVVVGGGNICRGSSITEMGIERVNADNMGMLATVINALALQSVLENLGIDTRVQSAVSMTTIAEPVIRRRALRHIDKGRLVIFSAGTGNPFFTTDTTAILRGIEMRSDIIVKGTSVDGIFSADPKKDASAVMHDQLSYLDVINNDLKVMDMTAISLAHHNSMPIMVCNIMKKGALLDALSHKGKFSLIK